MPQFSVIMPSRLADYPNAAQNREAKLVRAVNSVIAQTFEDWELHIIADGCQRTIEVVQENVKDTRIHLWKIEHSKLWSGRPRNTGMEQAQGDWIAYLDIDDVWGENHLKIVSEGIKNFDWIWFDDFRYHPRLKEWYRNRCDVLRLGKHGTSNIAHKRALEVRWDENGKYSHDYYFVQKLIKYRNNVKAQTPEYFVCHVPGNNSVGYDI